MDHTLEGLLLRTTCTLVTMQKTLRIYGITYSNAILRLQHIMLKLFEQYGAQWFMKVYFAILPFEELL